MPIPVVIHIISATTYCLLGAFQFHPGIRRRHPRYHRISGRILIPMGIAAALSGLWMTTFYALPATDYGWLPLIRWVFGVGMIASIVLAFVAVRRRDFSTHRAWMIRGYAIGIAAGTQVFTSDPVAAGRRRDGPDRADDHDARGVGGQPRGRGVDHPARRPDAH